MQHEHEPKQLQNDANFTMATTMLFNYGRLNTKQKARLWLRRLGYPSIGNLIKATKNKVVKGLDVRDQV